MNNIDEVIEGSGFLRTESPVSRLKTPVLIEKWLKGFQLYEPLWEKMKSYTDMRDANSPDEIWLLEHSPVFTQGQSGKAEHLLQPGDIPVVQTDRGGQVTYHGPGQLVAYVLVDLRRLGLGVRDIVTCLEQTVIDVLKSYGVSSHARKDAPGVYVGEKKIASLGLRVRKGCTFHGLAFNIDMDLSPFFRINPCGYAGLKMAQLKDFIPDATVKETGERLVLHFRQQLKAFSDRKTEVDHE